MTYVLAFAGGMAGSLHCVGMCGVFPLALASGVRGRNPLRQALYNLGRLNTLVCIGALSGTLGAVVVASGPARLAERLLAVAAGALMVAIGLEMLGVRAGIGAAGARLARATVGRLLAGVIASGSLAAPLALGVFNAFLPCQLIYAFAARAAATGSVGGGALVMLAFGAGTVPAMLALGVSGAIGGTLFRKRLSSASGVLVVAFGVLTALRAFDGAHRLLHGH